MAAPLAGVRPDDLQHTYCSPGIVARRFLAHGLTDESNGIAGIYFSTLPRLAEQLASRP